MRTTLDLNDSLLRKARTLAAKTNQSLTKVIEEALRRYLNPQPENQSFRLSGWQVVNGECPPTVDISDRDRLLDFMEHRK